MRALNALPLNLPSGSEVYADSAYTDYTVEDDARRIESNISKSHAEKEFQASRPAVDSVY